MDIVGRWGIYIDEGLKGKTYGPFFLTFQRDGTFIDETYHDKGKWISDDVLVMWHYDGNQPVAYSGNGDNSGRMMSGIAANFDDPKLTASRWYAIKDVSITNEPKTNLMLKK